MMGKSQKDSYRSIIRNFKEKKVLVVGDLMLDKSIYGTVERISPEAPIPVLDVTREVALPGGAGNVANNIARLGGDVRIVSVVGDDSSGRQLVSMLKNADKGGILVDSGRPTTIKTRIIAQHQQVVRVDRESRQELSSKLTALAVEFMKKTIPFMDAVLISDYGKGFVIPDILNSAINLSIKNGIPVTVDPKVEHFLSYRRVTCITPNQQEAVAGMRLHKVKTEKEMENLGKAILKALDCRSVIITRGEKGMSLFEKNSKPVHIPTRAKEVYDVTGAGDTVVSVLALCLASRISLRSSAEIANYAAGIVVGKLGTATVSAEELIKSIT
jgi:D-glycero-beta-D-manno-heptose-7-phosphate kinase